MPDAPADEKLGKIETPDAVVVVPTSKLPDESILARSVSAVKKVKGIDVIVPTVMLEAVVVMPLVLVPPTKPSIKTPVVLLSPIDV
jgi:hypothetical protein